MNSTETQFLDLAKSLDADAFWTENAHCMGFTTDKPRCGYTFSADDHWLFEFLDVESTVRYYHDKGYRDGLHRQANAITRDFVAREFFDEDTWEHEPKRIENLFGSEFAYTEGGTGWLTHVTEDPVEFARILDAAEATDIKTWALPEPYLAERRAREEAGKPVPLLGTGGRGPATIMTSVLKPEVLFYWMYDHPDLVTRFRDILTAKMIELNTVLREFSGNTHPGWWITDDNSALFSRAFYKEFCYPVLAKVLEAMAPGDSHKYQHSDSAMGHLMDYQYELGIRVVNYGGEVDAADIRAAMPEAMILGHTPPFLLRNGGPGEIEARVISDFAKAGATGGLTVTTAGSLAAGTGVGRMRYHMLLVQQHCRYD